MTKRLSMDNVPVYLGTDPEAFVFNKKTGKPVPAHRLGFPDKTTKRPVACGLIFRDGYALEFNLTTAFSCRGAMLNIVRNMYREITRQLAPEHELRTTPAVLVDISDFDDAPKDVLELGCDPSHNAYTDEETSVVVDPILHPYRYAGGHLHFSASELSFYARASLPDPWIYTQECRNRFVKLCDLYIGIPLTVIFNNPETFLRRRYYGRAGDYRFQRYGETGPGTGMYVYTGIEYRTPGPEVWNHPSLASMVFGVGKTLFTQMEDLWEKYPVGMEDFIQNAINTGEGAERFLQVLKDWYTPDIIMDIARRKLFSAFELPAIRYELHAGWYEWAVMNLTAGLAEGNVKFHV